MDEEYGMTHSKRTFTASECARRYLVTRAEWYRMVADGEAPQPTVLGNRKLWTLDSLIAWEESVLATTEG